MSDRSERRGRGRIVAAALGGVAVVALGVLYVVGHVVTDGKVPEGTTVAGVDIGGLGQAEAERALRDQLPHIGGTDVVVMVNGRAHRLAAGDTGLGVDVQQTASNAGAGGTWNPVAMVERLGGDGEAVAPVLTVDQTALQRSVSTLAPHVGEPAREPRVRLTGKGEIDAVAPRPGSRLDVQETSRAVEQRYLRGAPVRVEAIVQAVQPRVTPAEFRTSMREVVRPATSGPVTVQAPGRAVRLPMAALSPALSFTAVDDGFELDIDRRRLRREVADHIGADVQEPRDATVVLRNGKPRVVPGKNGVRIDVEQVMTQLPRALAKTGAGRTVRAGNATVQPEVTTAEARGWGIKEVVGSFETNYPHAEYRNTNQSRAAELITGTVLEPGETFSFNDVVGERTGENGFVPGTIIADGVYEEDYGGGVSQVVTTTFNAAFFAGLKDIEHKPHSFYIDRYPVGREATVAWGSVDLKFQNDTDHGVLIEAWVVPSTYSSEGEMHVRMWSTKTWDITGHTSEPYNYTSPTTLTRSGDECIPTTGYSGFDVDVSRIFRRPGSDAVVKRQSHTVTYLPANTVICE